MSICRYRKGGMNSMGNVLAGTHLRGAISAFAEPIGGYANTGGCAPLGAWVVPVRTIVRYLPLELRIFSGAEAPPWTCVNNCTPK